MFLCTSCVHAFKSIWRVYLASTITPATFLTLELLESCILDQVYYIINHKSSDCLDLVYKS